MTETTFVARWRDGVPRGVPRWNGPEKRDQERRDNEPGNGKEVRLSRRRFTKEFKLAAVRRLEAGESGSALARELEVKREKLYDWLAQVERYGVEGAAFRSPAGIRLRGARRPLRVPIAGLEVEAEPAHLQLRFTLPPGSYATVVLEELLGAVPGRGPSAAP